MAIPTTRGDPTLRHLALVVTEAEYLELSGDIAFDPPLNPGPLPPVQVPNTPQTRADAMEQFDKNTKDYDLYTHTEAYLKNQIIAAVPEVYINILRQPKTNFARVKALTIIHHLEDKYGEVTSEDLSRNAEALNTT